MPKKDIKEVYDPIIIDYDDEYNFTAAGKPEGVTDEKKLANYITYDKRFGMPLSEVEVDPGWEKETLSPKEEFYLKEIRDRFGVRGREPIPFSDLQSAFYDIGKRNNKRVSKFQITHMLRHMWRHGEIRRYIRGKTKWTVKKGRGEWYGIHYSLYPKKEEE